MEVRLFAAQTLSYKTRRQLQYFSLQDRQTLQRSLLSCLAASSSGPVAVLSQLCTAMANLIAHGGDDTDPVRSLGKPDSHSARCK